MAGGMTTLREPEAPESDVFFDRKVFKFMRSICLLLAKDVTALASDLNPVEDCRELSLL